MSAQAAQIDALFDLPNGAGLPKLIAWIDLECARAPGEETAGMLILARAVSALGRAKLATGPHARITATIKAAEAYASDPNEMTHEALFDAATLSYPFGPGDGCYAVPATGYTGCEPGSGCSSGAGCLALSGLDAAEAMRVIAVEIRGSAL